MAAEARNHCDLLQAAMNSARISLGIPRHEMCSGGSMAPGWTCVEDIIAYRLAVKLRDWVLALLDSGTIPFNYHLRDQIADSARSAPANISEGFDRYKHGQFGYHVGVAKGSLGELKTHLEEVHTRRLLTDEIFGDLLKLLIETKKTTSGLLRHLKTTEAPEPWDDDDPAADDEDKHQALSTKH